MDAQGLRDALASQCPTFKLRAIDVGKLSERRKDITAVTTYGLTSLRLMARRTQRLGDHSGAPNGVLDLHVSPGMASPATMPLSREEAPCARVSFKV